MDLYANDRLACTIDDKEVGTHAIPGGSARIPSPSVETPAIRPSRESDDRMGQTMKAVVSHGPGSTAWSGTNALDHVSRTLHRRVASSKSRYSDPQVDPRDTEPEQ
jgi:hypothetical protein